MIRKNVIPLILFIAMVFAACTPAATQSTEAVVEPTQVPTKEPTVIVPTIAATQKAKEPQPGMMDILDTIKADENLSLFYEALMLSGVGDILKGEGPFTVFAPTNDAINAVPSLNAMKEYGKIIHNHMFPGKLMVADLIPLPGESIKFAFDASGAPIMISVKDDVVYLLNTARVITPDIEAANGVLHVIDAMLLPQTQ